MVNNLASCSDQVAVENLLQKMDAYEADATEATSREGADVVGDSLDLKKIIDH